MPRASIDIGSNSILMLVLDDEGRLLSDDSRIVGLGKGLGDRGLFQADRMDACVEVLAEYAEIARQQGVQAGAVKAVATSAARRALNTQALLARVKSETGIAVRVVSGEEEADLTRLGALAGLDLPEGPVAIADLGGGSTELVICHEARVLLQQSLELGSARLTETYFGPELRRYAPRDHARLRDHVASALAGVHWPVHPRALVAVGGTVTTLACMELGLTRWDRNAVHGYRLGRTAMRRWIDRLLDSTPEERRGWAAVSPERANFMLAGVTVLELVCSAANRESMLVSDGGVRHGLLAQAR